MAYTGFVGNGYVGNFLTIEELEAKYPAQGHAGRRATVETNGVVSAYFSTGETWASEVVATTDPFTGGNDFSGDASTLKLPPGETDLTAGVGGVSANSTVAITASSVSQNALLFGGNHNSVGLGGYPKRKTLGVFESSAGILGLLVGGTANRSDDYSDPFVGDTWNAANSSYGNVPTNGKSVKIATSSFGRYLILPTAANAVTADVSASNVYVQIKVITDNQATNVAIRLYSTGAPATSGADYHLATLSPQFHRFSGDWQTISVPIEAFSAVGTGATLTAITHAGVYVDNTVSAACDILIGDVFSCPKILSKAVVIIGFDDCRADTWTDAAKYMMRKGIPGVLYPGAISSVVRASPDQFQMTIRQLELLKRLYGWQVAYQAFNSEAPAVTTGDFEKDMSALHALFAAYGLAGGNDGSYFSSINVNNPTYDSVFRKSFRSMRNYKVWSAAQLGGAYGETVPIADPYSIRSVGVDTATQSAANLTGVVDNAIARKTMALFTFHGVTTGTPTFTGLIDYLDANRATVDVMTMDQLVMKINAASF